MEEIDRYVIRKVVELRLKTNTTQQDVAVVLGVSQTFVASVENPKKNREI